MPKQRRYILKRAITHKVYWSVNGRYPYGIPSATEDDVNFCVSSAKEVYDSVESEFRQRGIL